MHTYLIQFYTYKHGNGYAIVNACNTTLACTILKTLGTNPEDVYKITSIEELSVQFGDPLTIVQAGITTHGLSAYESALAHGFVGTEEQWLASLKGPGGTTNYTDLNNKPSINNVVLLGNKSIDELGLAPKIHTHTKLSSSDTKIEVDGYTATILGNEDVLINCMDGLAEITITPNGININSYTNTPIKLNGVDILSVLNSKLDSPIIANTLPSNKAILPNVIYNLGTLTSALTFSLATPTLSSIANIYDISFAIGNTKYDVTLPTGLKWVNDDSPVFVANKIYEINIMNGVASYISASNI